MTIQGHSLTEIFTAEHTSVTTNFCTDHQIQNLATYKAPKLKIRTDVVHDLKSLLYAGLK